ncbi:MAG: serine hydrolase [Verrucomicrobiales bacterium]|nr:serine hydrolase [Verrucomicrobiales bacterium]
MRFLILLITAWVAFSSFAQDAVPRWEAVFEGVDSNRDGKISEIELEGVGRPTAWLEKADRDGDGMADRNEMSQFFQRAIAALREKEPGESEVVQSLNPKEGDHVTRAGIRAAEKYSADHEGHSFLLMIKGATLHESYANGWDKTKGHRLASGTKSFSGALLALAVKDGLLTPDEAVSATLTEWEDDDQLKVITIRQLLNLTSGIDPGKVGRVPSYDDVVGVSAVSPASEAFRYGPNAFQIFGEVLRRKLADREDFPFRDPVAYLEAKVFDHIGLEYTQWRRDSGGFPNLPSGTFITAVEWAKFGQLLLQEGKWDGKPLLDQRTLAEAVLPQSDVTSKYGLTFWLLGRGVGENRPWLAGAYMAAGAGKQRLFILPAVEMVVVRQGESRKFEDLKFLDLLFSLDSDVGSVETEE